MPQYGDEDLVVFLESPAASEAFGAVEDGLFAGLDVAQ